jgi:FMN phosphatase YigB (HAD superfamily)
MNVVVFDLDGTLANIDHRVHLVRSKKPQWDKFYAQCVDDRVNEWCKEMMNSFHAQQYSVYIVSARPETYRKETEEWLYRKGVNYTKLVMVRPSRDYTGDADLKRAWLKEFGKENILFVVDDRQRVVDMWRQEGVVCLQCYAWEEYKHAEGKEKEKTLS